MPLFRRSGAEPTQQPPQHPQPPQQQPPQPRGDHSALSEADRQRRRAHLVEQRIVEAQEAGQFDNLPGAGRRLQLDENPFAGDKALAYSLLKQNNFAPPEIERGNEIDAELLRADELVRSLRHRQRTLQTRWRGGVASERRAYTILRNKTEMRYAEALRGINSKILSLNIIAPAALHRQTVNVESRLRGFRAEFPPLEE